ncbi:unnamed protein product [Urochloa humidicola]
MLGVYSAAAAAAMLRRLGVPRLLLDAPVASARGDAKIGGGGEDPAVTTAAVDDRHQRRPAPVLGLRGALPDATTREQLYGARTTRTWAVHTNKKAAPGHVNVNEKGLGIGKVMLVARRGFCAKSGSRGEPNEDAWRRIIRFYKWRFFLSMENWLWAIGFRPGTPFRPYLVLLGFTMTSQSATEVTKWGAAAARLTGPMIHRNREELLGCVVRYVDGVASAVEEDGSGWDFEV